MIIRGYQPQAFCRPGLRSRIQFRKRESNTTVQTLDHAQLCCAPDGPGWHGLELAAGASDGWLVEDVVADGHCIGINLSQGPMRVQVGDHGSWTSLEMQPGTLWISSLGQPFSISIESCVEKPYFWAAARIEPELLDSVLGHSHRLKAGFGIVDDLLCDLFMALVRQGEPVNLSADGRGDLARSLIRTFVRALGQRHGELRGNVPNKGGLTRHQINAANAWIHANLTKQFAVKDMADCFGLTAAHFSRAFKLSTGYSPWQRVM
ncbi:MAG: helix-turn-helix transcriptional regulator, partial [Steroidobacteraceae bacterium]